MAHPGQLTANQKNNSSQLGFVGKVEKPCGLRGFSFLMNAYLIQYHFIIGSFIRIVHPESRKIWFEFTGPC